MSKIDRFNGDVKAFASEYQGTERTTFGTTVESDELTQQQTSGYLRGWGIVGSSEDPSLEDFNAAMFTATQYIAYLHQMGVPEWNALQEYPTEGAQVTHSLRSWLRGPDWVSGDEPGVSNSTRWKSVVLNEDLGTAAQGTLTTSDTDFTDGRVVRVGNGALFSQTGVDGQYVSDWDAFDANNYVDGEVVFQNPSTLNSPVSVFCSVKVTKQASNRAFIVLYSGGSDTIYIRRYVNDTPLMDWQPIITGNDLGKDSDQIATNETAGFVTGGVSSSRDNYIEDWDSMDFSSLNRGYIYFYDSNTLNMPSSITGISVVGELVCFKTNVANWGGFILKHRNTLARISFSNNSFDSVSKIYDVESSATSSQINTGTSTDTVVTPSGLAGSEFNPDNRQYESSAQVMSTGGVITVGHGLGQSPFGVQIWAECKVAADGFSVGDRILLNPNGNSSSGGSRSCSVMSTSSVISVTLNSVRSAWLYNSNQALDYVNWDLIIKAWI